MIGLGSNRLTVCRRGRMSVTQAGRGGMEWLAGGRAPLWSSPYSAQATAALKAQFPTQWPTIRDYGVAHPEIVGYMNAYAPEDAKIAYSLVEGIGTRYLVGDHTAYIVLTGIRMTANTNINMGFKIPTTGVNPDEIFWCYSRGTYNTINWSIYYNKSRKNLLYDTGSAGYVWINATLNLGDKASVSVIGNVVTVKKDGVVLVEQTKARGNFASDGEFCIYRYYPSDNSYPCAFPFSFIELSGDISVNLVPYKKNGAMGMIDLLTGTFYGNANSSGSFTESIESPA